MTEKQIENTFSYAVVQQSQTFEVLGYLRQKNQNKISFNSGAEDTKRKTKEFSFDKIHYLKDKFYSFQHTTKEMASRALAGQNQSALIYGTQEEHKDKILIGQSQNHGLLFNLLSQIFSQCRETANEANVTVKLSCFFYHDGCFFDIFGTAQESGNPLLDDLIEKKVLLGNPEIIVRNIKTALKIINICSRKLMNFRQKHNIDTQNLIYTIKLQLRNKFKPSSYKISKFKIFKFNNPAIHNNINGVRKENAWFVEFFNFLQAEVMEKPLIEANAHKDPFASYIIQCGLQGMDRIYDFTLITNKMTSNQCLTALKISNYLQNYNPVPVVHQFDISELKNKQKYLENQILNFLQKNVGLQIQFFGQFLQIIQKQTVLMTSFNKLQYEYAIILSETCEKLNKYIYNEQVQEFFYSKKLSTQPSQSTINALQKLLQIKLKITQLQKNVLQKLNKYAKLSNCCQKLFSLYDTMSLHFFYERNNVFAQYIKTHSQSTLAQPCQNQINIQQIQNKIKHILQARQQKKQQQLAIVKVVPKQITKKSQSEIDKMFTNTNVCLKKYNYNKRK